jgi:hypothetical protein
VPPSATTDICYTDATLISAVALGGTCVPNAAPAVGPLFCAAAATIATGLCDDRVADDQTCRKACDAQADCGGTLVCAPLFTTGTKGVCIAPPANNTCQTARTLTKGTAVTGNTGGSTSNYNLGLEAATCTGVRQAGNDVAYSINLTTLDPITVTLSAVSPNFDPSISLVGPGLPAVCDVSPVVCLVGADAGVEGEAETFTFTPTALGTYYLIVDGFSRTRSGGFTITVQ